MRVHRSVRVIGLGVDEPQDLPTLGSRPSRSIRQPRGPRCPLDRAIPDDEVLPAGVELACTCVAPFKRIVRSASVVAFVAEADRAGSKRHTRRMSSDSETKSRPPSRLWASQVQRAPIPRRPARGRSSRLRLLALAPGVPAERGGRLALIVVERVDHHRDQVDLVALLRLHGVQCCDDGVETVPLEASALNKLAGAVSASRVALGRWTRAWRARAKTAAATTRPLSLTPCAAWRASCARGTRRARARRRIPADRDATIASVDLTARDQCDG